MAVSILLDAGKGGRRREVTYISCQWAVPRRVICFLRLLMWLSRVWTNVQFADMNTVSCLIEIG